MTTFNFREPGEFGDGATMTNKTTAIETVSDERLRELVSKFAPYEMVEEIIQAAMITDISVAENYSILTELLPRRAKDAGELCERLRAYTGTTDHARRLMIEAAATITTLVAENERLTELAVIDAEMCRSIDARANRALARAEAAERQLATAREALEPFAGASIDGSPYLC